MLCTGMINLTSNASSVCPQATFHCSAMSLQVSVLRWFFNNEVFSSYPYDPSDQYPLTVNAINEAYNTLVGGVNTTITSASLDSNNDLNSLSIMTVNNISALQRAGVLSVSCGSFRDQNRTFIALNGM